MTSQPSAGPARLARYNEIEGKRSASDKKVRKVWWPGAQGLNWCCCNSAGGRHRYNCGRGELRGGTMLAQVSGAVLARLGLLFWAVAVGFVFGFMVGYAVRENISRRRRATGREAAEERYRELDGNHTLPRLE